MNGLCEIFKKHLNVSGTVPPCFDFQQFNAEQQALIRQSLTLSSRLPESRKDFNDILRDQTYLLNGTEPSDLDAVVFAQVSKHLADLQGDLAVENRHLVRWADLMQHVLNVDIFKPNLDLDAPREMPKKDKKGKDAKDGKDNKKESKDAKKDGKQGEQPKDGKKKEKKDKPKKQQPAPAPAGPIKPSVVDFRVGFIQKAEKHPDADSLYVSTIDVGEGEPRTICSGLVNYVPMEQMQQRYVVVVANLKPVKMRGIVSNGMVLCDSNKDDGKVEIIIVPEGSNPGDRVFFEGFDEPAEGVLNPKKKLWEQVQPDFTTSDNLEVVYRKDGKDHRLVNEKGEVFKAATLKNAVVS